MDFICFSCLMVSGRVIKRTRIVKTMIAMPMLLKQMVYSTTSRFNMGLMIISRQRSSIPKGPYLASCLIGEAGSLRRTISCIACSHSASTISVPGPPWLPPGGHFRLLNPHTLTRPPPRAAP